VRDQRAASAKPTTSQRGSLLAALLAPLRSTATIVSVFLVSLAFVLALVTLLDYFKFQSAITDLAEQRAGIIIARVHKSLETAIDLGLNLRAIGLERIVKASTEAEGGRIENSYVFAADDRAIIYSSDPAATATKAASAWLAAQATAGDGEWQIRQGDHLVLGESLDSALAAAIGGVVLDYSLADVNARVAKTRDRLVISAVLTFVAFAILAVGGAIVATREFRKTIGGLTEAISFAAEPRPLPGSINDRLRSSVDRFRRTTSEAHDQLDRVEVALAIALARRDDPPPPAKAIG
jgi:hypothetical protein